MRGEGFKGKLAIVGVGEHKYGFFPEKLLLRWLCML